MPKLHLQVANSKRGPWRTLMSMDDTKRNARELMHEAKKYRVAHPKPYLRIVTDAPKQSRTRVAQRALKNPKEGYRDAEYGERAVCIRCGQDIEYHGMQHGWIDRGGNRQCAVYYDKRRQEYIHPKLTDWHTPGEDYYRTSYALENPDGVRIVHNKLLGGWYVVRGPHQTPLNGRFNSKQEAQAWLAARKNPSHQERLDFVRRHLPGGMQRVSPRVPLNRSKAFKRAQRLLERFTGRAGGAVKVFKIPDQPKTGLVFGQLVEVGYRSARDGQLYRHTFKRIGSRPLLVASSDGKQVLLVGGRYAFTERGIEDR